MLNNEAPSPGTLSTQIKTMKLYSNVERIYNELRERGVQPGDALDATALSELDHYHYLDAECVREAATVFGLAPLPTAAAAAVTAAADAVAAGGGAAGVAAAGGGVGDSADTTRTARIIDVGAGLGGPARYLVTHYACRVTAVELQSDLHDTASDLTRRCGLSRAVEHVNADVLTLPLDASYDGLLSLLVFLHIEDKPALWSQCFAALRPGAHVFVEDFYEREPLQPAEWQVLREGLFCSTLPTRAQYEQHLRDAGFVDIQFIDMCAPWTRYVTDRHTRFVADRDRNVRVHGQGVYTALETFFAAVVRLFQGGRLGGVRVVARKPE